METPRDRGLRAGQARPWVIAHRGASNSAPENTILAFDRALRDGCDGIELDVQLSADGVPVVYHDATLARAGGGRRRVAAVPAADLLRLRMHGAASPRARLLALPEVLARYGRRTRLLVEIKVRQRDRAGGRHRRLALAVAGALRGAGLGRAMVLSFDDEVLDLVAARLPSARTVLNLKPPPLMTASLRARLRRRFALSADVRRLRPAVGRAVHAMGKPLLAYTCNTPAAVRRALAAGADAVMSDRPGWLRGRIEAR
jgi:glycerophosphoryl diester phosphodiesterase